MRFNLALAVLMSVLLIGVSSWSRFTTTNKTQQGIVAVEQFNTNNDDYEDILQDFSTPKTASTTPVERSLSNTDLIGRQLILDYIGLAGSGQATDASVAALAEQYVISIPSINKAPTINSKDIQVVSNIKTNFQSYANEFTKIHKSYAEYINKAYVVGTNLNTLNPELYSLAITFSTAYTDTALKLKNLPVPTSLVSAHIQLVNSYLSSATAMKAISETEQDSAAAFAGLITLNENLDKENAFINAISQILTSNGI